MKYYEIDQLVIRRARPWGVVTYGELIRCGLTHQMIKTRLRRGFLVRLEHEVYAVAGFPLGWQRQYKAAELSVRGAALAGFAAAHVHSLPSFRVARAEIVVGYTRCVRNRLATVHRSKTALFTTVDGFRVTTAAQTLFDITPRTSVVRLEHAMDDAVLTGKTTVDELDERRSTYDRSRKPGIELFRLLVRDRMAEGWAPPESELEALLWDVYAGIPDRPPAVRQAPAWWEARPGRKDLLIPSWRHIIEADGRRWHARMSDFDADRWRDNEAVAQGFTVQRFTYVHLTQRAEEARQLIIAAGRHRSVA